MALGVRQRKKIASKAQAKLPDAQVHGVALGHAGPDPMILGLTFAGAYVGIVILILVIFQVLVLPGGLIVILAYYAVAKPRYLVATDRGVAVFKRSVLNNAPTGIVARADPGVLDRLVSSSGNRRLVDVGAERVWVKASEVAALRAGLA
jgi:hypothetical protein